MLNIFEDSLGYKDYIYFIQLIYDGTEKQKILNAEFCKLCDTVAIKKNMANKFSAEDQNNKNLIAKIPP